jgi:hypothetical protein
LLLWSLQNKNKNKKGLLPISFPISSFIYFSSEMRAALRLNVAVVPRATAPALRYVHGSTMTAATRVPPLLLDSSRMQLHDLQRSSSAATWATSRRTPRALSMRHFTLACGSIYQSISRPHSALILDVPYVPQARLRQRAGRAKEGAGEAGRALL